MATFLSCDALRRRRRRGQPVGRHFLVPAVAGLEERTLLSPFPPNIQNNLGAYLSPLGTITGFPTTVTPGETFSFVVNISPNGVDHSFDGAFGYPFVAMSYAQKGSLLIDLKPPDMVSDNGLTTFYLVPFAPGSPGAPPDAPDPVHRNTDQQAVPIQVFSSAGDGTGMPITGPSEITVTVAPDAPAGTVTEVPSQSPPGTFDAPGPWVWIVGDYFDSGNQQHAWSTAIPFVIAPNVPFFEPEGFFGGGNPTPVGSVGAPLAPDVVVDVLGNGGTVNASYNGNVTITLNGATAGASLVDTGGHPLPSVTVQAKNGVATFDGQDAIIVNKAGAAYTLTATLDDGSSNPSSEFNIQGHMLKFAPGPASSSAGDLLPVQVEADAGGVKDGSFSGTIQLQLADASGAPISDPTVGFVSQAGVLQGTTLTANASGGTADFSKLLRVNKPGTYTLIASLPGDSSTPTVPSDPFTLSQHQVAIQLANPMGGGPNETLPTVQVTVEHSQGSPDPNYDGDVVLTLHGGGTTAGQDNGATLSGGTQPAGGGGGTTSFTSLMINQSGQGYTLTATLAADPGPSLVSGTFNIGHTIKFVTQPPTNAVPGEPLGAPAEPGLPPTPVQVEVDDSTGRPDGQFVGNVSVALAGGPAGSALVGASNERTTSGVATFSTLAVNRVGNGYSLTASLPSDPTAVSQGPSSSFDVVPHELVFSSTLPEPPNRAGVSGAPLLAGGGPLQVSALDTETNADRSYGGQVTLTLNTVSLLNPGGRPATLLSAGGSPVSSVQVPASAGVAMFSNVIISEPGTFTLTATAPENGASPNNMISDTSKQFVIGHDTPAIAPLPEQFAGSMEPLGTIRVNVENDSGQVDTSFTGNVTMTLLGLSKTGQAPTLGGKTTQPAVAGVATFSDLNVSALGVGYQLTATLTDGTQSTASDLFTIVPDVFQFVQTSFPNPAGVPSSPIATAPQVAVFLQTGSGPSGLEPDTQYGGQLSLMLGQNSTGAKLNGGTGPTKVQPGVFEFDGLSISLPSPGGSGYTLIPTDGNSNNTGTASPALVIVPHGVSFDPAFEPMNAVANQPPPNVIIVVNVDDLTGNPDKNYTGNVTLTLAGGSFLDPASGDPTSSLVAQAVGGRAHFVQPTIVSTGTLIFTAVTDEPGSPTGSSTSFRVSPPPSGSQTGSGNGTQSPTGSVSPPSSGSQPGNVTQRLAVSKTTVAAGQSFSLTDTLTINGATPMVISTAAVPRGVLSAAKKSRSKGTSEPTGTVLFEEGSTVLRSAKVKVTHGVARATAKLKLTTPGVQTISAVYMPDAASQKLGLSAMTTSAQVTVVPGPAKKKGKGK
jgi:hypothetical protein